MRFLFTLVLASALVAINHIGSTEADVSHLNSERKINLEDIERDTLINELHSKSQETLQAEPTEQVPPSAAGQVQHTVQHTGPTAETPSASGGAVSHQTIVYHQDAGQQQHQQTYSHDGEQAYTQPEQAPPTAPQNVQYHSGITYAQATPQYQQQSAAPGPAFHYSHSIPAHHPQNHAVQYVQQPQHISHGQPQVLSHQPVVYYSHHAHYPQEPIQYVTLQPQNPAYAHISNNQIAPPVPQVHEDGRTYSAPSRHTLESNTQQQKYFKSQPPRLPAGFRPKQPLINPQPQYIYVQANNAASAQQQRQYQQKFQQQSQQQQQQPNPAPQKVQNVEIIQSQGHQIAPIEYIQQQSSGVQYSQSTPYYQYSGSFGHPQTVATHSSVPVNNYVVVPYATTPNVYQHQQQQQQQAVGPAPVQPSPPSLAAQPIVPEVPHYVHPTKNLIPSGPPQVFIQPPHQHTQSFIPHQHQHTSSYPTLSYAPTHPSNAFAYNHGHNYNYYQPSLDLFGQYSRHTSLLDSYVPSNVIYNKARQLYNPYYSQSHSPVPAQILSHPHHHQQIDPDNSIYNTIAYSTEQKPVVVAPPSKQPLAKRESTVLRAAAPPAKPTTLTKVEKKKTKN